VRSRLSSAPPSTTPSAWRSLLEKSSAKHWRGWESGGLPKGWSIKDGVIAKDGEVDDLVTRDEYANFEIQLEWKLGKAGNSGIFYRGTREYDHIYWSAPEYQLLDDENAEDGKSRLTAAGSDYGLYGAPAGVALPFDHWNKTRLLVKGNHVEHWLNGKKVASYDVGTPDWDAAIKASKFGPEKYPKFGYFSGLNLLALIAASQSALPTSYDATFLPFSQCSTCFPFATMRVWFHSFAGWTASLGGANRS